MVRPTRCTDPPFGLKKITVYPCTTTLTHASKRFTIAIQHTWRSTIVLIARDHGPKTKQPSGDFLSLLDDPQAFGNVEIKIILVLRSCSLEGILLPQRLGHSATPHRGRHETLCLPCRRTAGLPDGGVLRTDLPSHLLQSPAKQKEKTIWTVRTGAMTILMDRTPFHCVH